MMRGVEGGMIDRRRLFFESYPDELSVLLLEQASWGYMCKDCKQTIKSNTLQGRKKEGRRKVVIQKHSHEEQTVPEDSCRVGRRRQLEKFSIGS
jgi:hypothetical protein